MQKLSENCLCFPYIFFIRISIRDMVAAASTPRQIREGKSFCSCMARSRGFGQIAFYFTKRGGYETFKCKNLFDSLSSAALGGEGLFHLCLNGSGIAVLESPVPMEELIVFEVDNDEIRIDRNMAIAWSCSMQFTVEHSSKSLLGSAVSGEGLVNVFRGSGKLLISPL